MKSMSLQLQLDSLTAKLRAMVPAERLAVVDLAAAHLSYSGLAEQALKIGDRAPALNFPMAMACSGAQRTCSAAGRW